jgi:predicted metal-dependent phosphoesterase TrpH
VQLNEWRYRRLHEGRSLDYNDCWWTPPLGPREAYRVEREQIERLGMKALVSLTDHDNIEAPLLLRVLPEGRHVPISLEWTISFEGVTFHLGVHNLSARKAAAAMTAMEQFTANPRDEDLEGLLDWLADDEAVLIVFNHPYWDEKCEGPARHAAAAEKFVARYRRFVHALEVNGLRPWTENRKTLRLGMLAGVPVVAGGDRHCLEPNALINLSNAGSFSEFVEEVRVYGISRVLLMPQYREPLPLRLLASITDVMRDNQEHTHGWTRWSDRVFFLRGGEAVALSAAWQDGGEPAVVRLFVALSRWAGTPGVMAALRRQMGQAAQEFSA